MRRRRNPYSCIEKVRGSRQEALALILITVAIGLLMGLLTDGLAAWLREALLPLWWGILLGLSGLAVVVLTVVATQRFFGRAESQRLRIDIWLPYHFPKSGAATIEQETPYRPPRTARRVFMRRYRAGTPELTRLVKAYGDVRTAGQDFRKLIAEDHMALTQCLALYALHRYGNESIGSEVVYKWGDVSLQSTPVSMDGLPAPLRDNAFLRADQRPDQWRLLLPQNTKLEATELGWTIRHRRYGRVAIRWLPELLVAGRNTVPYHALTRYLRLPDGSRIHVIGSRFEARAYLRRTLLPASEPFHEWATGLLARLEEVLDFGYHIATRPDHIIRGLEWKIGWVPDGTCIVEMLQAIEGRLEQLEMAAARASVHKTGEEAAADLAG